MNLPILSIITFTPLLGAIVLAVIPSHQVKLIRRVALGFALLAWVMSLGLLAAFAFGGGAAGSTLGSGVVSLAFPPTMDFRFIEAHNWIPTFGIQYKVGIDGLSILMVVLTTTLTWVSILASFKPINDRVKGYMISFLVLEVGMIGVFVALDLFLFYIV